MTLNPSKYYHLMFRLGMYGVIFMLLSLGILVSSHIKKANASQCFPTSTNLANGRSSTNWRLQEWIRYKQVPIAASRWTVPTRFNRDGTELCFVEDWRIQKVVLQSSRDDQRGKHIDLSNAVASEIEFSYPSGTTQKSFRVRKTSPVYCRYLNIASCYETKNVTVDPAYNKEDRDWSPMGQYGLLFTDNNNLQASRGFIPIEWLIVGN